MLRAECDRGGVAVADALRRSTPSRATATRWRDRDHGRRRPRRNRWSIATGGPHGAEDRRDAVRLPDRRAVRSRDRPAAARAGAARVARRRARAIRRPRRRLGRRGSVVRRRALSREPSLHASRAVGPGDPADSSYWNGRDPLTIDLLPDVDAARWLVSAAHSTALLPTRAGGAAAGALRAAVVRGAGRADADAADSGRRLRELAAALQAWKLDAVRDARLQQGRGHARWRRHPRALVEDDGGDQRSRASSSSARSSTSPAGSAATTSSGRGHRAHAGRPVCLGAVRCVDAYDLAASSSAPS